MDSDAVCHCGDLLLRPSNGQNAFRGMIMLVSFYQSL